MTYWTKPKGFSKSAVDRAGVALIDPSAPEEEVLKAIDILDNWRAIHSYPMHVFKVRVKRKAKTIDPNALTVQRLKRIPAIEKKLEKSYDGRPATMKLSQMQDIGGCRAVLSNVQQVKILFEKYYLKSDLKHKLVKINNYIAQPKPDGYRGIHLIYKYVSDKGKTEYNNLLIEIQLRSKLQHLWATAIETVDFITRQSLKSDQGSEEWMEFFRLVSSAFAKMENCPTVLNTPDDERELYLQIKRKEAELNAITLLTRWAQAIDVVQEKLKETSKFQYFLLQLDIAGNNLSITQYTEENELRARADYLSSEKKNRGKKEYDVVLVGADASADLKKAYPNYFADTKEFVAILKKIIDKYSDSETRFIAAPGTKN